MLVFLICVWAANVKTAIGDVSVREGNKIISLLFRQIGPIYLHHSHNEVEGKDRSAESDDDRDNVDMGQARCEMSLTLILVEDVDVVLLRVNEEKGESHDFDKNVLLGWGEVGFALKHR